MISKQNILMCLFICASYHKGLSESGAKREENMVSTSGGKEDSKDIETTATLKNGSDTPTKRDRAALFSEPRIFPFLEQLFNPLAPAVPPAIVPVPPALGVDQFFGFPSHSKPDCAAVNGLFCLYDSSYPSDQVNAIVDRFYNDVRVLYSTMYRVPVTELLYYDNRTHKYREGGHFVCESQVQYVRPGWARNIKGEWLAIINTDFFPQTVRVEECKYANKRCEYLPPCYKSQCIQRFSFEKLLCVDPHRSSGKPFVDIFEIPTACSCFVENFIYY